MKLKGKTLPNFYSILSLNGLQADRYLEKYFIYYSSQYQKKYKELLRALMNFQKPGSKLLDRFVLRTRIEKTPKLLQ